ncbi:hypothetical protein ACE38W_01275 [Chitinophaga sp. Hz27]|uniref:hypothetical protein n=1 Tax=Chitinophaga sp. Hz27 TaxID=3347169 RepID=UPI0035D7BC0E
MKKLRLKMLDLGATEVLSREQLKQVMGGADGSGGDGSGGGSGGSGKTCSGGCGDGNHASASCETKVILGSSSCQCSFSGASWNTCGWK